MKTEVLMKRDFNGANITQRTGDRFFNATELMTFYNANSSKKPKELKAFFLNKNTHEFLEALSNDVELNRENSTELKQELFQAKRGVNGGTYMHPYLFVKFAMWLSPEFEVQIIKWVYDNLIDLRMDAGDHYNEMCKTIKEKYEEFYQGKPDPLIFIKEANFLNMLVFGTIKGRKRNEATEEELAKINQLQKANIKLITQGMGVDSRKKRLKEMSELL